MNTPHFAKHFLLKLSFLFFLFIFSTPLLIFGQKVQVEFFPNGEYLSGVAPLKIKQDKEGFLWVLGQSLDRFNGYNFTNIKKAEKVWADYYLRGVNRDYVNSEDELVYQSEDYFYLRQLKTGKKDSIYYRDFLQEGEVINEESFHQTANGEKFFFIFKPSNNEITFVSLEDGKLKRKFSKTDMGKGNEKGFQFITSDSQNNFYYLNKEHSHFYKIDNKGKILQKIPYPLSDNLYSFIKIGANNAVYICISNQLYYLKENASAFELHPINTFITSQNLGSNINDILELPNGDLWVCQNERGLLYYNKAANKVNNYKKDLVNLTSHRVDLEKIINDQSGIIWIKTKLGIIKIVPQKSFFDNYFTAPDCDGFCSFRGIVEGEKGQIFASYYHSIFQINPKTKTTENPFPNLNYTPYGLGYDNQHLLLNNGHRLNISTGEIDTSFSPILEFNIDVGAMVEDNLGNWWNGQQSYLYFLDTEKDMLEWKKKIQIPNTISNIFQMHFGKQSQSIWIANGYSLFQYDIYNNTITEVISFAGGEKVYSIFEDKNKNVWVGTEHGLAIVQPDGKILKRYTTKDGLPHNSICGILSEGDSCLWLATNYGLSRFQMELESFTNFYTEDGLSHNEFNRVSAYKAKDGQMFFGGMRGINAFYPQEVMQKYQKQKNNGKVLLSSISRANENLDTVITTHLNLNNKTIEFSHWDKSITFEVCLTDFQNPQKNQFSYLLEGYDKVWSTPSRFNFAKYTSLPAGNYIFRAKAFDGRGNWNPSELEINVEVLPPWWKTTWAYVTYGLIFCGIFYGGYRVLVYRMELKNQVELEQKERLRLKELDSFKSRLFTNLTHEFRTPLTVILGMAKQVSKGTQELQIDENIQNRLLSQTELIEKNGQGLLRLVNQLLDLSKLENNAFTLSLKNADILPFLNYTVSSFQSYANQQNLVIKFSTNLSKLEMDFDANCLQQVMTNLISNAIKFTSSGGEIFTNARKVKKSKTHFLQIEIRDTGIGIPSKKLPNIFDRFFQVDGSTTRAGEGTGIGLAHTKELVKLMDGEISVKSILKEGTTFFINIPIKNEIQKVEKLNTNVLLENQLLPPNFIFDGKRIDKVADKKLTSKTITNSFPKLLLIEDNPDVVTYLKTCLEKDYEIEVAFNGRIGIEKAIQNIPDLIISDVMMPEKDGYEVCDFLKNDEKTSHIPIILLTAKADVNSKIHGLKRGANAYLSKPFISEELEVRLKTLLENQKRMQAHFSPKEIFASTNNVEGKNNSTLSISEDIKIENIFLQKIENILEENFADDNFALPQLCQKIGMSRSQLFRKIKALTGEPPSKFIRTYRLKKAKLLLLTTELNVSEVARETGFGSLPHFSRVYQEEFGFTPSATPK